MTFKNQNIETNPQDTDLFGKVLSGKNSAQEGLNTYAFNFEDIKLLKVIIPVPFDKMYTYITPVEENVSRGSVVEVNFANKTVFGLVWEVIEGKDSVESFLKSEEGKSIKLNKLKEIKKVIDINPFSDKFLKFIKWTAEYNLVPLGSLIKVILGPVGLLGTSRKVKGYRLINKNCHSQPEGLGIQEGRESSNISASNKKMDPLAMLEDEKIVRIDRLKQSNLTPRQQTLINHLQQNQNKALTQKEIHDELGITSGVIKKLVDKNVLEVLNIEENSFEQNINLEKIILHKLSDSQRKAYEYLKDKIEEEKYSTTLLEGVTGSGKTEVFFHCIADVLRDGFYSKRHCEEQSDAVIQNNIPLNCHSQPEGLGIQKDIESSNALANNKELDPLATLEDDKIVRNDSVATNKQILILLPEIVLTSQLIARFTKQFGFEPAVWHSMISKAKKRDIFKGIVSGNVRVVIGTRSALFLPYRNLGLVIVDEEHEASFKQVDIVSYNGRDMAVVRASMENFPIILSSATPSIETLANVEADKYGIVHLASRYGVAEKPDIELVDMCNEKLPRGEFISNTLKQEIEKTLSQGKQTMLYLNRRGYAPVMLCDKCGEKVECPNCSITLTKHKGLGKLVCHHCGFFTSKPKTCKKCGVEDSLIAFGPGVERIKEEVEKYFPKARVALMTSDTVKNVADAERIVKEIADGEIDIIIGTQMIAKGHHFPALTLVGILDADAGLYGGDPRASERTYQLLTQVAGRAGREKDKGKVFIQTFSPDNLTIQTIVSADKQAFTEFEMQGRELANLPPFGRMIALIISGINENMVVMTSREVIRNLPISERVTIFGPSPAPITRVNNRFRYRILVSSDKSLNLQKIVKNAIENVKAPRDIRIKIDVDPYSFL